MVLGQRGLGLRRRTGEESTVGDCDWRPQNATVVARRMRAQMGVTSCATMMSTATEIVIDNRNEVCSGVRMCMNVGGGEGISERGDLCARAVLRRMASCEANGTKGGRYLTEGNERDTRFNVGVVRKSATVGGKQEQPWTRCWTRRERG